MENKTRDYELKAVTIAKMIQRGFNIQVSVRDMPTADCYHLSFLIRVGKNNGALERFHYYPTYEMLAGNMPHVLYNEVRCHLINNLGVKPFDR